MENYEDLENEYHTLIEPLYGEDENYVPFDKIVSFYNYLKSIIVDFYNGDSIYGKNKLVSNVYGEEVRNYKLPENLFLNEDLTYSGLKGDRVLKGEVGMGLEMLAKKEGWFCFRGVFIGEGRLVNMIVPVRVLEYFISEKNINENNISSRKL